MLAIWSPVPLPFLNPAWTSGSSQFTYCLTHAPALYPMVRPNCCCQEHSSDFLLYTLKVKVLVTQSTPLFATPWTAATRLLCPWNAPGNNIGGGCHFLLQGIFPTQGFEDTDGWTQCEITKERGREKKNNLFAFCLPLLYPTPEKTVTWFSLVFACFIYF